MASTIAADRPVRDQLVRECREMIRHGLAAGLALPPAAVETAERVASAAPHAAEPGAELRALIGAHGALARSVAPATPRSLDFLAEQARRRGMLGFLGPVPLVRRMMLASLVSLAVFVAASLSSRIDGAPGAATIFTLDGMGLLVNEALWLSAAAMGAAFAILFRVHGEVSERRYDPGSEVADWTQFALGIVAGFIMVALVPLDGAEGTAADRMAEPTIAMLGGFSASAVHALLKRLVDALEWMVRGDAAKHADLRARLAAARRDGEAQRSRLEVATSLVELRLRMARGAPADEVERELDALVRTLAPPAETSVHAGAAAGAHDGIPAPPTIVGARGATAQRRSDGASGVAADPDAESGAWREVAEPVAS